MHWNDSRALFVIAWFAQSFLDFYCRMIRHIVTEMRNLYSENKHMPSSALLIYTFNKYNLENKNNPEGRAPPWQVNSCVWWTWQRLWSAVLCWLFLPSLISSWQPAGWEPTPSLFPACSWTDPSPAAQRRERRDRLHWNTKENRAALSQLYKLSVYFTLVKRSKSFLPWRCGTGLSLSVTPLWLSWSWTLQCEQLVGTRTAKTIVTVVTLGKSVLNTGADLTFALLLGTWGQFHFVSAENKRLVILYPLWLIQEKANYTHL